VAGVGKDAVKWPNVLLGSDETGFPQNLLDAPCLRVYIKPSYSSVFPSTKVTLRFLKALNTVLFPTLHIHTQNAYLHMTTENVNLFTDLSKNVISI